MNHIARLFLAIIMGACVYYIALSVIPSLRLFEELQKSPWIDGGDVTQISLLILSLILISVLSRGNLSTYGFKSVEIGQLIKPVLISVPAAFIMIIIAGIIVMMSGSMPSSGGDSAPGDGLLKDIISIVIIASICEEIFARGLIQGFLAPLQKYGFKLIKSHISVPVIVSALGFGLGHLCLLGSKNNAMVVGIVISATVLGFIAGYYREKTESLLPAVAVHMTFNIVGFSISLLMMS